MNRQFVVVAVVAVIAVVLVAVVVRTHKPSRVGSHTTVPGVLPNATVQSSGGAAGNPCVPGVNATNAGVGTSGNGIGTAEAGSPVEHADHRSTTPTAATTQGTTPDGSAPSSNNAQGTAVAPPPTGTVAGAPCTSTTNETSTGRGTAGSGTTSIRPGGASGSGQTHGAQSDR